MRRLIFIVLIALAFASIATARLGTARRIATPAITVSGEDPSATSLTNFIAYWRLDETSGTRNDVSANAQHLTDNNTVTSAAGIKTNAASFASASSEYLSRADSASLSTGDIDFTFAVWVKATTFPSYASVFRKSDALDIEREYALVYADDTTKFRFFISTSGADLKLVNSTASITTGNWYFIIVSNNAATKTLSISINNGASDTNTYTGSCRDGTGSFNIGAHPFPGNYWNGLIDEVGFWKRTLTAAEQTYLYNSGAGRTYNSSTGKFE